LPFEGELRQRREWFSARTGFFAFALAEPGGTVITCRRHLVLALLLSPAFPTLAPAEEKPTLTATDQKYLDGVMKELLFDPKGAERVALPLVVHTVWARSHEVTAEGWLVPGKDGKSARVYFSDGASIPAPAASQLKKVDFVAACRKRYSAAARKVDQDDVDRDEIFRRMRQTAVGTGSDDDLALAAWLHRLGEEELAARALAAARKEEGDPEKRLRDQLAWSAFAGLVHAYMVRADEEALAHGEHLLRRYGDEAKGKDYGQAAQVVGELKRRQKKGTFGKVPPAKWPDGFAKWDTPKKLAYLIDALDEVDARQMGQPGGVDLASDRRVAELIRQGDPAVPVLLEVLEKDKRLTRSVHFWRDFARSRTVLSVREAALTALMSILRVRVFEPRGTGDNFTARGDDEALNMARRLRAYWKEYGNLPFGERMMKVLTDPKTTFEAKREAVENLATLTEEHHLGTTVWTDSSRANPNPKPNPVVAKFTKPTVAEAILAAMDADLKAHDAKRHDNMHDYYRRGIEAGYFSALVQLGDKRIAEEVVRRSQTAQTIRMRRNWARAAYYLGKPGPLQSFADDFGAGRIHLPADKLPETNDDDQPGNVELRGIIGTFIEVGTPEADRALDAVADPKHPQQQAVAYQVLPQHPHGFDGEMWLAHPYCLRILRAALDDTTLTGRTYLIEKGRLFHKESYSEGSENLPELLANPAARRDQAAERACDAAALKLCDLVVGVPEFHPLLKDADQQLGALKATLDRFGRRYRRLSEREAELLGYRFWGPGYIPNIRPLDLAATADDVKTGKAVFHLGGKGKPAGLKLPAVAVLKSDPKKKQTPHVLIVQAEVGPDGAMIYGIISRHDVRAVAGPTVTGIKTLVELQQEDKATSGREKR
jgi:hypothetical protein